MKIDSSAIGMESARSYRAFKATVRHFSITEYRGALAQGGVLDAAVSDNGTGIDGQKEQEEQKEQDGQGALQETSAVQEWQDRFKAASGRVSIRSTPGSALNSIRQMTMRYIFGLLFGYSRYDFWDWERETVPESSGRAPSGSAGQTGSGAVTYRTLNYTQESYQMEAEDTFFSTRGTVRTADGREIDFQVHVGMSRRFESYYRSELDAGMFTLCDPLVINLDTDVAELSDQTFFFDIDADGEKDEISRLGKGSGYLALDKNGDGVINDGSELFGTSSGDGFADLAEYDDDGNGWIDENDAVWSKLQIWTKDENGQDVLYHLKEKGVGAICLKNAATDFTLQGSGGQTKGAIRRSGVFLYENGNVGTVQHVDVASYSGKA